MFRFGEPAYLWLLLLIPLLVAVYAFYLKKRHHALRKFGEKELISQLSPEVSEYRPHVKFTLLLLALTLIVFMLARPQMGTSMSKETREGIETIIALDISNSMMAEDVAPSRLEKSKLLIENLVDKFRNDRIGLIVFAGDAFVQLPITTDYVSAKMFLQNIDPSLIQAQGTDIGEAIDLAMHSFTQDEQVGKAIVLITDGEDHEGGAEEMAKTAEKKGIRVFILGVGSDKGVPIPDKGGGYMQDKQGDVVISKLNEDMCRKVAAAGKGTYIHVDNGSVAEEQLDSELGKMQKGTISSVVYSEFDEQFQAVGIIVILLLVIEVIIQECKNRFTMKWNLFRREK